MKKILISFLIFAFLIFIPFPSYAKKTKNLTFTKTQITNESWQQNGPLIFDDTIIWTDFWSNPVDHSLDIWGYSFETGQKFPIITRPENQFAAGLTRKYILYSEYIESEKQYDVRAYNRETKEDFAIANGPENQLAGDIWGNFVAYTIGYGCGDLYLYNLKNGSRQYIASSACVPRMQGGKIVWYTAGPTIKGYDISKKKLFDITNQSSSTPDIWGNKIVFVNANTGAVFVTNLKTGIEKQISVSGSWPTISNRYVAWVQDDGIGAHNMYAFDFRTEQTVQISNDGPQQPSPTIPNIWRDTVVWMSWHTGNGDVYAAKLGYE